MSQIDKNHRIHVDQSFRPHIEAVVYAKEGIIKMRQKEPQD